MRTAMGGGTGAGLCAALGAVALALVPAVLLVGAVGASAEEWDESKPWPSPVEGWVPPGPGEHPRLFFRRTDLPRLRARAKTAEGKAVLRRLRELLNGTDGESMPGHKNPVTTAYGKKGGPKPGKGDLPVGTYSMSHAAGYGLLYQITGEKRYADLGRECFEWAFQGVRDRDREARYSFKQPGGALRAGPSLGWYAVGYDLCYDGWDEDYRRKIAQAIVGYNEGEHTSFKELVRGSRHMPGSNHWGMQVGGGALAALAVWRDPGVDSDEIEKQLEVSQKSMIRNVTEGFGDHGWFAEGDGTGSMASNIIYNSAALAWKVAGGRDFVSPRPNVPWTVLKWIFLTVPKEGKDIDRGSFPCRGAYPHNVWARTGLSGGGYFAQGFGSVTDVQKAGLLWFYNRHLKERDEGNGGPFDTVSLYPHRAVLSFVSWPFGMKEENPADVIPRAVRDRKYGFYMFRNRWRDGDDIVVSVQTKNTRGWHRANTGGEIAVWGMGKRQNWGRLRTDVTHWQPAEDGSAIVTGSDGTCLAVDFSGASGADGMLVMTGPGAGSGVSASAGGTTLNFLFLTKGAPPSPREAGGKVVVGGQTVSFDGQNIVLGKMAGPWKGPKITKPEVAETPVPPERGRRGRKAGERAGRESGGKAGSGPGGVSAEVMEEWDAKLLARVRAVLEESGKIRISGGRPPRYLSRIDERGRAYISMGGMSLANDWSRLGATTKKNLAAAVAGSGRPRDHALAAFFCLAAKRKAEAKPHLVGAGHYAEDVEKLFE